MLIKLKMFICALSKLMLFEYMYITSIYGFNDNFVCSFVVEQILSGETRETIVENIHSKLMEVGEKVRNGDIPIELYYITKVQYILTSNLKMWIAPVRRLVSHFTFFRTCYLKAD